MPKPQKVDDFLDLVRRSGLVERDQLNRVLRRLKEEAGGAPVTDVDFVGQRLVEAGLLSQWQCNNLLEGRHKGFFLKRYRLVDHLGISSLLSVIVVLRRMAFIGQGISHAGFGGVGLAAFFGLVGAWQNLVVLVFCLATAISIARLARRKRVGIDAAIGILLVGWMFNLLF